MNRTSKMGALFQEKMLLRKKVDSGRMFIEKNKLQIVLQ